MKCLYKATIALSATVIASSLSAADTLLTHRIPAALAIEAASETVSECAKQGRMRPSSGCSWRPQRRGGTESSVNRSGATAYPVL